MSVVFEVELSRKSGNKGLKKGNQMISANDRMHHHVKGEVTSYLRGLFSNKTLETMFTKDDPCKMIVTIYPPTKRRMDSPNWYPTVKALVDGLNDANLFDDDNDDTIIETTFRRGKPTGTGKYKIELRFDRVTL